MITLKSSEQIDIMDEANRITNKILDELETNIKVGITTQSLDDIAEELIKKYKVDTAFKGYRDFTKNVCISINEEIVHGVPSERVIQDGDLVSLDFGVKYKNFYGDAARTLIVGFASEDVNRLVSETKRALYAGIEQMRVGKRLWDIGRAIDQVAKENGFGNLRGFCGHGIGTELHEEPHVFNYVNENEPNIRLRENMVLALEPMFTLGSSEGIISSEDKWTVVSKDGSLSAHWELSIAVTQYGPKILGNIDE